MNKIKKLICDSLVGDWIAAIQLHSFKTKWEKENPEGCAFLMRAQHNIDKNFGGRLITSLKEVDDYIYNR